MADVAKRVDYDQIAPTYAHRYENNRLAGVEDALLTLARERKIQRVLEVGCGTGRWLASLSSMIPEVVGFDLSMGMLQEAHRQTQDSHLVRGRAGRLPFKLQSFDLVFCVNALHHFSDPIDFISTGWASLKPGGCLAIIGQEPLRQPNRWYVYDFFEGTYETDLQRFHTWETLTIWMQTAGFEAIQLVPVERVNDPKSGAVVLEDPFLQKNATSQLALLSDQAYQQGIQRILDALKIAQQNDETLIFQVDLQLEMLIGWRGQPAGDHL